MKNVGRVIFAGIFLIGVAILAYNAGYTAGTDMAERDNRAEAAR